ncbi:MAG: flagellar motor protein MotB [Phycisphaerales bacterium]
MFSGQSNVGRPSLLLRGGLLLAAATLALGLGGCTDELKADNARLTTEVEQLKSENSSLMQNIQGKDAQIQQLQMAQAAPANTTTWNQPTGGSRSTGSGGGGGTVIEVAGDVLFASGQTAIKADGKKELDKIAAQIKSRWSGNNVRVEGYADKNPIKKSKFASNEALSQARADEVMKYLVSKGVSSSRVDAVGMGSVKLRATDAQSRRVEIVIVGG